MDPSLGGGDKNMGGFAPPRGYALSGKIMLTAIVVLFTVVLLIVFLHLYVRWRLLRIASRRRRRRNRNLVFAAEDQGAAPAATRGLEPETIKSLPVLVYSVASDGGAGGGEEEVVECAVCLNEFEEGEKVRCLPRCGHRFHIDCIDMWFHSHTTCPLCRSAVKPPKPASATAADSVQIQVTEATPPPPPPASSSQSDLCSTCRSEDGIGSSSSSYAGLELRIEVPVRRGTEEEPGLGLTSPGGFKSPGGRIRAIRRLLSRDLRLYRGGGVVEEPDLEWGEGAERVPSRPPTPSPRPPPPLPLPPPA